jgi:DNA-binding transcriptional LysR family regulator
MRKANFSEAEAFLALADHQGFGAAALELGITQSTMSRRIAALESRIGHRLVERTTRRVALTEAGKSYAAELRDILLRLESADARVQNRVGEPEGLLRITMPAAFGRVCVIPCLTQLIRRHPKLRFELDLSDRYINLLDGGFDAGIRLAAPAQSGVHTQWIGRFSVYLCASPHYIETNGSTKAPQEITKYDFLALRTPTPGKLTWKGRALNVELSPKLVISDVVAMHRLVMDGVGIAFLPAYIVDADIASGKLVDVLPGLALPHVDVFVAYPQGRETLSKVAALLQELKRIPALGLHGNTTAAEPASKRPKGRGLIAPAQPRKHAP